MNILITSAGRRYKVVEYFKSHLNKYGGQVIATDLDINAPALYAADTYEIVPRITDDNYIETLINICKKYEVSGVFSLIDPELSVLIEYKQTFEEIGVTLITSNPTMIEMSLDKYKTYQYLNERDLPSVPTYITIEQVTQAISNNDLSYPLVAKPREGSSSLGIVTVYSFDQLGQLFKDHDNLVVQPFLKEKEYGIDVYVDLISHNITDIFIKEKLRMRAGETDKAISVKDYRIEKLILDFIEKTTYVGPLDIDCFEYNGNLYISEINPRFGGGYPHAHEMGIDFPERIINNLNGKANPDYSGLNYKENKVMMKYDNIMIK
ncbi:ATP-grasp domain-containing protein [Salicibibacter cibi]|uniref:ATP-grasp domain-containing protein n=1 Tax=Salicibibacter cibi TaxID=2743001 RepID=A0A7T7CFW9_9BACI|nr:ATP-grasp domain-containing protein [Salicibibacter cibi]QQK80444.1 ATP-grasp domain-containing protein [Salicibibacter cibi]